MSLFPFPSTQAPSSTTQPCPLCASNRIRPFYTLKNVPVLTNLLLDDQEAARRMPRGTIHLVICERCGFIFNDAFAGVSLYTDRYDNSQAHAASFLRYINERIQRIVSTQQTRGGHVVEVGCGDGFFLRRFIEARTDMVGYGFDPSYRGPLSAPDGRFHFEQRYYDERCCDVPADMLICRHVIEHIPQPLPFLRMLRRTLSHSPQARAFFETPTIEWILRNRVIWDIYYEHCSYFAPHTIALALELAGFHVEHIEHTFGDQYLWIEATASQSKQLPRDPIMRPGSLPALAAQFQVSACDCTEQWQSTLHLLRQDGPVALLGAAGKGVTLANLLDPGGELISCLVDVNPHKHHKYLPGTGHPIIPYEELSARGIASALLLNPNYYHDTVKLLESQQASVRLVSEKESAPAFVGSSTLQTEEALDLLVAQIKRERLAGRTIVFTNGVFDLLHMGHLQFLRYAKTLGDILIVAIDTDASTRRLKGPDRPINHEQDRLTLVAALDMVDYTLLFESNMLASLIRMLRPHIYLKGGDYRGKTLPVGDALQEVGGRSIIAPLFSNDLHTSRIIERIAALATRQ